MLTTIFAALTTLAPAVAAPASWGHFQQSEGERWVARFDPATGTALRAWGPGILVALPVGGPTTRVHIVAGLDAFLARNIELIGVNRENLRLRSARYLARNDTWYVDYDRLVQGAVLWGAGVTFRVRGGKIVMIGLDTHPGARVANAPARDQVVFPDGRGNDVRYRAARIVRTETVSPPGRWTTLIDAHDGSVYSATNAVRWLDGVLYGTHDVRTIGGGFATSPLPYVTLVSAGGASTTTDRDGAFSVDDADTWTAYLEGTFVRVTNDAGAEGDVVVDTVAPTMTSDVATQAEIDSYVYIHQVREWGLRFAPDLAMLNAQLRSKVNVSVTCAAYWDGAINFGMAGDGCNNPGQIADVNYHEWGHAFHEASVLSGTIDVYVAEAVGDLIAALQTLSPEIAPTFYESGRPLRDISTLRVYPDDLGSGLYYDSLIVSGAVWDLFTALQSTYGEGPADKGTAWAIVSQLLVDAIVGGPSMTTVYDEFVLADDDDGDLSNGTPHLCALVDAFGAHGLGPLTDGFPAMIEHAAIENQPAGTPVTMNATVRSLAPGCLAVDVAGVRVEWSVDGESASTLSLDVEGTNVMGTLDALPTSSVVEYALVASAADGREVRAPAVGTYTFYVGDLWPLWCEDFSTDDGGFTHEALSGNGISADDWAFGAPSGMNGDPLGAYTGASVWGNDVDLDGAYPFGAVNRLHAPPIAVDVGAPLVLQFRRWLTLDDAGGDVATVYANDTAVWTTADAPAVDDNWVLHTVRIDALTPTLHMDWELSTDAAGSGGGWTVDDVCLYAAVDPNADTGASDTGASDTGEPTDSSHDGIPPGAEDACGCGGPGSPGVLSLLLVAGLRRRRRSA